MTDVHFHEIALLKDGVIAGEGREVAGTVVDGDAGGEGHTTLEFGLVVDGSGALLNGLVAQHAEIDDLGARDGSLHNLGEHP
jgi:hypothetical protein